MCCESHARYDLAKQNHNFSATTIPNLSRSVLQTNVIDMSVEDTVKVLMHITATGFNHGLEL
jgi:hypothetical protein